MTRKSAVVNQVSPTSYVELHSETARKLKINNGDKVKVITRRGKVTTIVKVTDNIEKNWLFMPFHFQEGPANMLTNDALDPIAKIPELKVCAATIKKV